jgi:hypothetical protein
MFAWMVMLAVSGACFGARAQDAATGEQPATAAEAAEGAFSDEELQALVAPIALYPDLVLVLVLTLQASLAPLDIVQADRFLADYAGIPRLSPIRAGTIA